jgi:hypothetical protein
MPTRCNWQTPPTTPSWLSVQRCWATFNQDYIFQDRLYLEDFHWHMGVHHIPYWGSSYKVFVLGNHSRQFITLSLRSLLSLDHIPRIVRIPVPASRLSHECIFCGDTDGIHPPFEIVPAVQRSHGRPRRKEAAPTDSTAKENPSSPPATSNS